MEQSTITPATEEDNVKNVPNPGATSTEEVNNREVTTNNKNKEVANIAKGNLLYEECLGFIPNSLKGRQDPRYAKFFEQYKDFDYTNEDFLNIIEDMGFLQQLLILQISKPNKSIDVYFRTEDAADFFVKKHIEIRGKLIPFIRKAKRILRVTVKDVHPEITDDTLLYELQPFIEHCSSIKNTMKFITVGRPSGMPQGRSL